MSFDPPAIPPPPPLHPLKALDSSKVRALGWLLIVLGLLLSGGIGAVAWFLHDTILHNGQPGSHTHWEGNAEFTRVTFELFGAVIAFGLGCILCGVYQASTGRRQPVLVALVLLTLAAMFYFGYNIMKLSPSSPAP